MIDENDLTLGTTFNDSHRFENDGAIYFIQFFITNKKLKEPLKVDSNMIVEFSYTSELNYLCITGYLDIIDTMQELGKIFSTPFSHLQVVFEKLDNLTDMKSKESFYHTFIITNMEIKGRINNTITYRIYLISTMWYKLIGKVQYSNWDCIKIASDFSETWIKPENSNPINIILQLLELGFKDFNLQPNIDGSGSIIDKDSFDKMKQESKCGPIKYINGQNTLLESINYLMNAQPYLVNDISDFKMNFIIFDLYKNKYRMIKIDEKQVFTESAVGFISDKGGLAEKLIYKTKLNLGSVVKKSILKLFKTFFKQINYTADQSKLMTDPTIFHSSSIIDSQASEKIFGDNTKEKFNDTFINTFDKVFNEVSELNYNRVFSNISSGELYKELFDNFVNQDTLILNVSGKIVRQPGQLFILISDESTGHNLDVNQRSKSKKSEKDKNGNIVGIFFVSKVQKIIRPSQTETSHFTENLVLSRLEDCIIK